MRPTEIPNSDLARRYAARGRADVDTMTPKLWFVHADHLDRPVKMTDGAQALVWDALYRPFGALQSITGSAANNLRFPGQYFLIESGLHYNWHRHYDPTIGRYVQADPLAFVNGPSVFAYALSAPTQYIDPDGTFVPIPVIVGIAGGAVLDYAISKLKSSVCSCGQATSTTGAYSAVGGSYGFFGPFVGKPGGIAGGGYSGPVTSVWSRYLHSKNPQNSGGFGREAGRFLSRASFVVGAGLLAVDAMQIAQCYARQ